MVELNAQVHQTGQVAVHWTSIGGSVVNSNVVSDYLSATAIDRTIVQRMAESQFKSRLILTVVLDFRQKVLQWVVDRSVPILLSKDAHGIIPPLLVLADGMNLSHSLWIGFEDRGLPPRT